MPEFQSVFLGTPPGDTIIDGLTYSADPLNPVSGDWRRGSRPDGTFVHDRFEVGQWVSRAVTEDSIHTDHFIMTGEQGGLLVETVDGHIHHMVKPSVDGHGVVLGNHEGRFVAICNNTKEVWTAIADTDTPADRTVSTGGVTNFGVTTLTFDDVPWGETESVLKFGIKSFTAGVKWRVRIRDVATDALLVETATDYDWENEIGLPETIDFGVASEFSFAEAIHEWPVNEGLLIEVFIEFKSGVDLDGAGTVGLDWIPFRLVNSIPLTIFNLAWFERWEDGREYFIGDEIFENGKLLTCTEDGVQTGSFAANSTKWLDVQTPHPPLFLTSDITLDEYNVIAVDTAGGGVTITIDMDRGLKHLLVFDHDSTFTTPNPCIVDFGSPQGTFTMQNFKDYYRFYWDGTQWRFHNENTGTGGIV